MYALLHGPEGLFSQGARMRLIGVGCSNIDREGYHQMDIFSWAETKKAEEQKREEKRNAEMAALRKEKTRSGLDAARGIGVSSPGALDLSAAVRDFIGRAGVLPQMGNLLSGMSGKDRETILANVETIGKWVTDSLAALGVVKADARIQ